MGRHSSGLDPSLTIEQGPYCTFIYGLTEYVYAAYEVLGGISKALYAGPVI